MGKVPDVIWEIHMKDNEEFIKKIFKMVVSYTKGGFVV